MRRRWAVLVGVLIVSSCGQLAERKQPPPSLYQLSQSDLNLSGEQLAKGYCAACHVMPSPEILDRTTWEKVLPDMRKRMGLYLEEDFGAPLPEDEGVPEGIYSKIPFITRENWEKLQAYYLESAPETPLPQVAKTVPIVGIPGFQLEEPVFSYVRPSLTTLLHIHPQTGKLWLGHRFRALYELDPARGFLQLDSIPTSIAPVEIHWKSDHSFELLAMGLMDPANDSLGVISTFSKAENTWKETLQFTKLMRPVHVEIADWNGDGKSDYAISQFGNHLGKFSLHLSFGDSFQEQILKKDPGARRSKAVDFEGDGDLDILVLMTQAKESLLLFENLGSGKFKERQLLSFHPAFGSSDFRFEDMNGDSQPEIILVNGDNADQSQILKNYHGVRIFERDKSGEFQEKWFYPMHGASGLEVGDFDQDGKKDLIAIAFFPDRKQKPNQNLIYFKQEKQGVFQPYVLEKQLEDHWLTLTKGDLDLDGDEDLIIGTFAFDQLYQPPKENWRPFVILKNQIK
ncbi:VCBS repeat-containing protein [Algoriphagus sp. AK58]|uniref:FG-GAP repeat domain-containing protein n=1 Tax=Algoriphagus sp. AK58 TaxID=1406877 RepID=UPI00164F6B57|nr:VCBS repeat-containing protein [Algoriphagus sp. AK58]MBC6368268.1 VCBS repeat-containing protein [Algoriphagus sp. AK58]